MIILFIITEFRTERSDVIVIDEKTIFMYQKISDVLFFFLMPENETKRTNVEV